jgi:hypothetical protein
MNSRPGQAKPRRTAARALEIYDSIRQVLNKDWDPICIANEAGLKDEYDAYIAPVYRILVGTRSESDLIEYLRRIEREELGIDPTDPERLLALARKLLTLSVTLDEMLPLVKEAESERNRRPKQ